MNRRRAALRLAAVAYFCAGLLGGCAADKPAVPDAHDDRPALLPVSLPDVSSMEESAQKQLREAYASLTEKIESPAVTPAELGAAYGQMGTLFMAAEYFHTAEPFLLNAQTLAASEVRWPYYLAHLYRARNEPEKTASFLETSVQLRPDYQPALMWLGDVYIDLDRPGEAEPLFLRVLSKNSQSAAALFGLGRAALARRDYSQAVERLQQALSLDDRSAGIRYSLAMAYRGIGNTEKAEAELRQSGPRGPMGLDDPLMQEIDGLLRTSQAYRASGVWLFNRGDRAASLDFFHKASEIAPDDPGLRHELGVGLFLAGDVRGAVQQFQEALRLSPTFAKAHYSLGVAMAKSGLPQPAIEHLSAAIKCDPSYIDARLGLGDFLRQLGRDGESLAQYELVLRLDPRVVEARMGYAMALVALKRTKDARTWLAQAMKAYPDHPEFAAALERLNASRPQ